jgi:hypothetical protein
MGKCRYLISCSSFLNIASVLLKHDGNFVAKTFQGAYYNQFYTGMMGKFRYARAYPSVAARKRSAEAYVVEKDLFLKFLSTLLNLKRYFHPLQWGNAIGEQYTGNPYVRFDEGTEVVRPPATLLLSLIPSRIHIHKLLFHHLL